MIPGTTPERSAKALKRARVDIPDPDPEMPWEEDPAELWDMKPIVSNGREFFTIKYLAQAWDNRTIQSIRKLEREGIIPKARFRRRVGRRTDRLYSREQIESLVQIAKGLGVYSTKTRLKLSETGFREQLLQVW